MNGVALTAYERIKCQQFFEQVINDEDTGVGFGGRGLGPTATTMSNAGQRQYKIRQAQTYDSMRQTPVSAGYCTTRSGQDFAPRYQELKIAKQIARGEIEKYHDYGCTLGGGAAVAVPGLFGAQRAWPRWQNSAGFMPLRCQIHGVMLRGPKDVR